MILLDTNVISEPLKPTPNPSVLAWIDAQAIETLFLSTVSLAELRFGIAVLPQGKRKQALRRSLDQRIVPLFAHRIVPFGVEATDTYATLRARARAAGHPIGMADACIAAIAATHKLTVATRDTRPFDAAGATVVNPWKHDVPLARPAVPFSRRANVAQ